MKNKIKKIFISIIFLFMIFTLLSTITFKTFADTENIIYVKNSVAEANESGLVVVEVVAEGQAGASVQFFYQTEGITAIPGLDFVNVNNNIKLKIGNDGKVSYKISIKCLNTAENREKLRVYDKNNTYGRYFNLIIYKTINASLDNSRSYAKCYLPYDFKVEAVTDVVDGFDKNRAYLKEYANFQARYHKGISNLDGKSTWYTFKKGNNVTFTDVTEPWVNTFINTGFASAYGSYVIKEIGEKKYFSTTNIHVLYGGKEFMDNYSRSSNCPGLSSYFQIEPCYDFWDGYVGYEFNDKAMRKIVFDGKSPYDDDDDLVDIVDSKIKGQTKRIYWNQKNSTWYSGSNNLMNSAFFKINPYKGVLDTGLAVYNGCDEIDRVAKDIWQFLTLVDDTAPEIVAEYVDDSDYSTTGKLKFYVRFNEPVHLAKTNANLTVFFNNSTEGVYANYSAGNFTDTLVFEMAPPKTNITDVKYQLPNNVVSDMAYNLDKYKNINNNIMSVDETNKTRTMSFVNGVVNLLSPTLTVDLATSGQPQNIYNLLLSINDNGEKDLNDGKIYYKWSKEDTLDEPEDPKSYDNCHEFTSEENGSFTITLVKNAEEGIDSGVYYLFALAESGYGLTDRDRFGPYVLDGDPPTAYQITPPINELKTKEYSLAINKKGSASAAIRNIDVVYKYIDEEGNNIESKVSIIEGSEKVQAIKECISISENENENIYKYKSTIDTSLGIPLDPVVSEILSKTQRQEFDMYFYIEDTAGNRSKSNVIRIVYDTRDLFRTTVSYSVVTDTESDGYTRINDIDVSCDAFNIATATNNKKVIISIADGSIDGTDYRNLLADGTRFSIKINGDKEVFADGTEGDAKYRITLTDLPAGYYDIVPRISGEAGSGNVDIVAQNIKFYLSNNKQDETENYKMTQTSLVLTNKVYQLENARFYYLDTSGSKIISYPYGATYDPTLNKAEGGSTTPAFTNINEAKKYIRFMELQDLYLIKINSNIASLLNSGTASTQYVKADGETVIAQDGQLWIRYKKNIWTPSSSAYGWAYYYYGNGRVEDGINISALQTNLNNAINDVVSRISNGGNTVYLVEEETINQQTGAPYLTKAQIHNVLEEASVTKTGISFVTNAKYDGDQTIYKNTITVLDNEYPLVTNMELVFNSSTRIFYKKAIGTAQDEWVELIGESGKTLAQLFNGSSQPYLFREYGLNGICEYAVYFDKELPILNVKIGNVDSVLDGTISSYSSDSFIIKSLSDADNLAYVAIYSYPNKSLKKVLYAQDLQEGAYKLDSSNYYLQVGDRSGNIFTYIVLLSSTNLEIEAKENDSKTSIIVKVLNRSEDEIYSYEIYLNETLVTSEYAETKVLKDPGIYRITVRDIYGGEVTQTIEFSFKSPEINWFYLNSSETYSKFDPENIVRMAIYDDEKSSRISNVYTSAMLKLQFVSSYGDDPIKFELLDINSSDYSYSESTDTITINSLTGFRLRVWYQSYPENDHLYVVRVDTEAPIVSASYIGVSFARLVEYDDEGNIIKTGSTDVVDFSKYNQGDYITVDTLAYVPTTSAESNFESNAVINGGHIVLEFSDPSKIKGFTIARNGQNMQMTLNENSQLILKNYGYYELTVTDMLGNVKRFNFTNTKDPISSATIDEEVLYDSVEAFGHDSIEIGALYPGDNRILVRTENESNLYELRYDGSFITYGRYICHSENIENENNEIVEVKSSEFSLEPFTLDIKADTTRENVKYTIIEHNDYIISVKIVDSKPVYIIEAREALIDVEATYVVGNCIFPSYYKASLSKEAPELRLLTGGEEVEIKADSKYIYIADDLTIDSNFKDTISKIEVDYSEKPTFGKLDVIYDGNELKPFIGTEYGFYEIVVTNIYNNKKEYIVAKVDSFETIVKVTYLDGATNDYISNEETIYSNSLIEVSVYSDSVNFEVNGEVFSGLYQAGVTTLELHKQGEYTVKISSSNGVSETFKLVIDSNNKFIYKDEWLTGYNEKALLLDLGYTNHKLTPVITDDIQYVAYKYGENPMVILYDTLSEYKDTDQSNLNESIGNDGIGDYIVYFRNNYGDLATKTIHYSDVSNLKLSRKIVDSKSFEGYSLEKAINENFYSNYVLKFETESLRYEFTIDGNQVSLDEPKTLEFSNSSGNGSFGYDITYLDEYGNYITFKAELYRTDVIIDTSQMEEIILEKTLYTKDNIIITFADNLKATVSVDGADPKEYKSGTKMYKDGSYEFIVEDIAGNRNKYNIIHKSVNQFDLIDSSTNLPIIIGGVVNNSSVVFTPTDDSRIKSVFKNSTKIDEFNTNTFSTTGHWEIIIEDSIGNTAYAGFYIINNSLVSFDYKAPFDYQISEVWYTNSKGLRELLDVKGDSISLTDNGDYSVVLTGKESTSSFNFSVNINDTPPQAKLVGVEDGGITARNVSLSGLKSGDIVEIYKDGKLITRTDVALANSIPEITTGGTYKIVVTSVSGAQVEYNFTRKQIANAATSVFIIIVCFAAIAGITIGLLYHTRLKNDSEK